MASVLLISSGQTGAALLQLAVQTETFSNESVMLARAFMEKMTNFCYVSVCDDKEYRGFLLHPIYKNYHNILAPSIEDVDFEDLQGYFDQKKEKQEALKQIPIVQEALAFFSETKHNLKWTNTSLNERIQVLQDWNRFMDFFFTINKIQYYADASEALHGSLYGCTYGVGVFDSEFGLRTGEELEKKLFKENACVLLHLGMLIHETLTLISYATDIKEIWEHSYENRSRGLKLLMQILERKHTFRRKKGDGP
ncbi:hypothetical protein [Sinomicrobium sp. M5D2P9]